jgi:hypothetical protein
MVWCLTKLFWILLEACLATAVKPARFIKTGQNIGQNDLLGGFLQKIFTFIEI